jgi:hypothetical protein
MRARVTIRGLALAGAAVLTLSLTALPASGATPPSWRVVTNVATTTAAEGWTTRFAVTGAGDAWSAWTARDSSGAGTGFVVQHWTGKNWVSANVSASQTPLGEASVALAAGSGTDAWIIDAPGSKFARVLRWNGTTWVAWAIPPWALIWNESDVYRTVPVIFGPRDVWIFNLGPGGQGMRASRYNGRKWTVQDYAGIPDQVSIDSRTDIWALGTTFKRVTRTTTSYGLMRWNGRRWLTIQFSRAVLPGQDYVKYLVATGPKDVWVSVDSPGPVTQHLLHWDGRSLTQAAIPAQIQTVYGMTKDGHGGFWVYGTGPAPSNTWYFADRNGGKWTVQSVPTDDGLVASAVTGISWIPGTRSVWATAEYPGSEGTIGAILKFGP